MLTSGVYEVVVQYYPPLRSLSSHLSQMSSPQGKYWVFTWNNPTLDPILALDAFKDLRDVTYVVFQCEFISTRHFQGYIEFSKLKRLSQLKRVFPAIHWERRKGSQQDAIDYCSSETYKGEKKGRIGGPWSWGTPCELAQGKRNDLIASVEALKQGGIRQVAEEHPETLVRYPRGMLLLASLNVPVKPVPEVILLFGPTGVGKTRRFYQEESDRWASPVTDGLWFDGYVGQAAALFDDFAGKFTKLGLAQALRIFDRYDVQLPVKGGFAWFVPERIYVTTNLHPRDWYDYSGREEQYAALERRFTRVLWWKSKQHMVELTPPSVDGSIDLVDGDLWRHFWDGPGAAQLGLDMASGRLVSNAPANYYDF